jgi:drug/metabolite transporter (DMT)-like permease
VIIAGALIVGGPFNCHQSDLLPLGTLDVLGSSLYAVATSIGRVSLVAVEASLYPVVTVSLAARLVHEHLGRSQRAGVALTLSGIAAIAAGS